MHLHEIFEAIGNDSQWQKGQRISVTDPNSRPPKVYNATITAVKMFDGESWASVQFDQDANGNYSGPSQQEWSQMSQGNMINLHWARPLEQQGQQQQQQAPQQQQQQAPQQQQQQAAPQQQQQQQARPQ